jgi:hypothetical protein
MIVKQVSTSGTLCMSLMATLAIAEGSSMAWRLIQLCILKWPALKHLLAEKATDALKGAVSTQHGHRQLQKQCRISAAELYMVFIIFCLVEKERE